MVAERPGAGQEGIAASKVFPDLDPRPLLVLWQRADGALAVRWRLDPRVLGKARAAFGPDADPALTLHLQRAQGSETPVTLRLEALSAEGSAVCAVPPGRGPLHAEIGLANDHGGWLLVGRSNRLDLVTPVGAAFLQGSGLQPAVAPRPPTLPRRIGFGWAATIGADARARVPAVPVLPARAELPGPTTPDPVSAAATLAGPGPNTSVTALPPLAERQVPTSDPPVPTPTPRPAIAQVPGVSPEAGTGFPLWLPRAGRTPALPDPDLPVPNPPQSVPATVPRAGNPDPAPSASRTDRGPAPPQPADGLSRPAPLPAAEPVRPPPPAGAGASGAGDRSVTPTLPPGFPLWRPASPVVAPSATPPASAPVPDSTSPSEPAEPGPPTPPPEPPAGPLPLPTRGLDLPPRLTPASTGAAPPVAGSGPVAPRGRAATSLHAELLVYGSAAPGSLLDLGGHPYRVGAGGRFALRVPLTDHALILSLLAGVPALPVAGRDEEPG